MIGRSHPARDDVLAAISLLDAVIRSDAVQGADFIKLCAANSALRKANDKLRPVAPFPVTQDCPVVPIRRPMVGLSGVNC